VLTTLAFLAAARSFPRLTGPDRAQDPGPAVGLLR
jgi:hypothetical protein